MFCLRRLLIFLLVVVSAQFRHLRSCYFSAKFILHRVGGRLVHEHDMNIGLDVFIQLIVVFRIIVVSWIPVGLCYSPWVILRPGVSTAGCLFPKQVFDLLIIIGFGWLIDSGSFHGCIFVDVVELLVLHLNIFITV